MDRLHFRLIHDRARQLAIQAVKEAPDGYVVDIKPRTRSLEQNAMLHSIFSSAAKEAQWCGRKLTPDQWKTLFISAHASATGIGSDMVPGLEGEFVNIREASSKMTVARMNSLLEYVMSWCAENNIKV